jgi:hypothetical protein
LTRCKLEETSFNFRQNPRFLQQWKRLLITLICRLLSFGHLMGCAHWIISALPHEIGQVSRVVDSSIGKVYERIFSSDWTPCDVIYFYGTVIANLTVMYGLWVHKLSDFSFWLRRSATRNCVLSVYLCMLIFVLLFVSGKLFVISGLQLICLPKFCSTFGVSRKIVSVGKVSFTQRKTWNMKVLHKSSLWLVQYWN